MDFNKKNALVSGMARSGISAAILLKKLGANVTIQDLKSREKLGDEPDRLEALGIELYLGKNPDEIIGGFDLLILSPGVPTDLPFIAEAQNRGVTVWSEVEFAYRVCKCPVLGITGTNGKTTTTALLGQIVKNYKSSAEVVGNIGVPFCDKAANVPDDSYIIAELSSFQLEKIQAFKPYAAAVLNITPDHLNRHKTLENYIKAKENIFKNQTDENYLILNYDDEHCRSMQDKAESKCVFFSASQKLENGIYADDKSIYLNYGEYNEKIIDINEMNILGRHNTENAMAAAMMAVCIGIPLEVIRKTLREFKAVEHRIEFVTQIDGVDYYNDSKGTNPDAAIKAIEAMKKPILLIGGGYDKGSDFGEWISCFKDKVKFLAVLGEVSDKIIETAEAYGFKSYERVNSLKAAVELCKARADSGDCVLLSPACASWDMFESYEQRGELFKQFVYELSQK